MRETYSLRSSIGGQHDLSSSSTSPGSLPEQPISLSVGVKTDEKKREERKRERDEMQGIKHAHTYLATDEFAPSYHTDLAQERSLSSLYLVLSDFLVSAKEEQ